MGDAKHFLGAFVAEFPDGAAVRAVREIGEEEYRDYAENVRKVLACRSDYRQFTMVRHAYVEYASVLRRYEETLAGPVRFDEVLEDDIVHDLNRRLRGFFSEFRVFLDYSEAKLKRRHGRDSEELRIFKEACSRQFDGSFAYRFVYGLRNYALHVNLPLNAVSLTSGGDGHDPGNPYARNRLSAEVDRDLLLRWSRWKGNVRSYLERLPPKFELRPYIDEAMACLERIHLELFCAKLPGEKRAVEPLLALAGSVGRPGTPCVFRVGGQEPMVNGIVLQAGLAGAASSEQPGGTDAHVSWIPVEVAGMVVDLPDAEELLRYEYIDWQIVDATPANTDAPE